jgi:uroporphyrinogen III methyltransferase/synthase
MMSLLARRRLEEADVIVTDRLIDPAILVGMDPEKIIHVGKAGGIASTNQGEINELLVRLSEEGKKIARLKGGDPLIFGRGGEELEILAEKKIPFEIVPGVTAASVAASFAGIPLTHRDAASTLCFVTGQEEPGKTESAIDYGALAKMGTIVFYMSISRLRENLKKLIDAGLPEEIPGAIVERAGSGGQRTLVSSISTLADLAEREGVKAPAIVIVGKVVTLREKLGWFEKQPLFGKTIVLTRPAERMAGLQELLLGMGADVIAVPTIKLETATDGGDEIRGLAEGRFDWLVLTSPKGVESFVDRLKAGKIDVRSLSDVRIAVIGSATADRLRDYLIEPDLQPKVFTSAALTDAMITMGISQKRILLFRAELADDRMAELLRAQGAIVTQAIAYRTQFVEIIEPITLERLERSRSIDAVVFTSSSTVRSFCELIKKYALDEKFRKTKNISIGPITSEQIRQMGMSVSAEAEEQNAGGIVKTLLELL